MMSDDLLLAARRTEALVGRTEPLEMLRKAIYTSQNSLQIISLLGPGGFGKSRLIEEVLWRIGNPKSRLERGPIPTDHLDWDWTRNNVQVVAPDLLDMSDIRYHTRTGFMQAVRDALVRAKNSADFSVFDSAFRRLQQQRIRSTYQTTRQFTDMAEDAFFRSYNRLAAKERVVLILDTCEKLAYSHSNWLIEENLIQQDELTVNLSQWLGQHIRAGSLHNTTLILVGRKEEGKEFFDLISDNVTEACKESRACALEPIQLTAFSLENTIHYFRALAATFEGKDLGAGSFGPKIQALRRLATDTQQIEVLWRYTGGQPVRLALYADLIVEGVTIPERLLDSPEDVQRELPETLSKQEKIRRLEAIQSSVEIEFIHLLFGRVGLRAEILKALVRAPRGLDEKQLYYAIYPDAFDDLPDPDKLLKIQEETGVSNKDTKRNEKRAQSEPETQQKIGSLRSLSIVKVRPEGRLGLQDEIYKIYALMIEKNEQNLKDEKAARQKLAIRMGDYAQFWLTTLVQQRRKLLDEDESRLMFPSPASAHQVIFPHYTEGEQEERVRIREAIAFWEQEKLHYALLADLTASLNDIVSELSFERWKAYDDHTDFLSLEEIYQVLYDDAVLKFVPISRWDALKRTKTEPIDFLRRMLRQSEVIRWMQRFVIHGELSRAEQFYTDIEDLIEGFEPNKRRAWQHTFSRAERLIWHSYVNILQGETEPAIKILEEILPQLENLANHTSEEVALPNGEYGFIGDPGYNRLRRVIALGYNWLGYGYVNLGQLRQAISNYAKALKHERDVMFRSQMAITLNNLSRALSDMGRGRARRICLDGLNLNKEQGSESYIAYSYNTLALINNDQLRPELAWIEAATAVAYFRRAENSRGLGLALIQLGEALRRMAKTQIRNVGTRVSNDLPDAIYEEARAMLEEAIDIFTTGTDSPEIMRRIEALIEMGCLLRDRLRYLESTQHTKQVFADALNYFNQASYLAKEYNFPRLCLDAEVNAAWVYYIQRDYQSTEKACIVAESLIPKDAQISPGFLPSSKRDDMYVFQQLSKIYGLRGEIAMRYFQDRVECIEKNSKDKPRDERYQGVKNDVEAQQYLEQAARFYVLQLAYIQLFSPRSAALTTSYDALYEKLKSFNGAELAVFYKYQKKAQEEYKTADIRVEDLSDLGRFINECLGEF